MSNHNKLRALKWARSVCSPSSIDELLAGADACEEFLESTGTGTGTDTGGRLPTATLVRTETNQDAALDCAASVLISCGEESYSWPEAIADARKVFCRLTGATSSTEQPVVEVVRPAAEAE